MSSQTDYTPPKVWQWNTESGGTWASTNRPIAGPTHDKVLPVGKHPLQLYSLGTPNGQKVTILLEELLAIGEAGAEYDAHLIKISDGDQFSSGFVAVNPNSKIPALMDHSTPTPTRGVLKSGVPFCSISQKSLVTSSRQNTRPGRNVCRGCFGRWVQRPYLGGGFGHFYSYAPIKN